MAAILAAAVLLTAAPGCARDRAVRRSRSPRAEAWKRLKTLLKK